MVEPLQQREPGPGEVKLAYRFVHVGSVDEPELVDDFRSDREGGLEPENPREEQFPELLDGMSAYRTRDHARTLWARIAARLRRKDPDARPRIGDYIARVRLVEDCNIRYEDLNEPDGHMTIWGDPSTLVQAVDEISLAEED